jgi:hypothetical protein
MIKKGLKEGSEAWSEGLRFIFFHSQDDSQGLFSSTGSKLSLDTSCLGVFLLFRISSSACRIEIK